MAKPTVVVPIKRRLTDLYSLGKTITINDDSDNDPIEVYLSKINDLEQRQCVERSSSTRAKFLLMTRDKSHEGRGAFVQQLETYEMTSHEGLVDIIISPRLEEARQSAESEIAADEEWAENGLLDSLREAWNDKLETRYLEDPEDEDAKRVYEQLFKFAEQVDEVVDAERVNLRGVYADAPYETLLDQAVDRLIEVESDSVWVNGFMKWRLFFAVRDPENHRQKYFESKAELDDLDGRILQRLLDEYEALVVSSFEGKD